MTGLDARDPFERTVREALHVDAERAPQLPLEWIGPTTPTVTRGWIDVPLVPAEFADEPTARQRRRPAWILVAAAAAVMAIVVSAVALAARNDPIERVPAAPPSTAPAEEVDGRVGFIGLPPPGAIPSTPERGELVVFVAGPDLGSRTWVYADGRLIWHRYADLPEGATPDFTGYLEQRLTPEGVELLRSEADALVESDGGSPDRRQACRWGDEWCEIQVRSNGRVVIVPWPGADSPIVARITDPASWLPASAWEDQQIRAYVPARYRISHRPETLNLLPQAAQDLVEDPVLTIEELRLLAGLLEGAGLEPVSSEHALRYHIQTSYNQADLFVFDDVLPHGQVYCQHCG